MRLLSFFGLGKRSPRKQLQQRQMPPRRVSRRLLLAECLEDRRMLSHFRSGAISFDTLSGNSVRFDLEQSWRSSAFSNVQLNGSVNVGQFSFGDNTSEGINLTVTSLNTAEDYFVGRWSTTHSYAMPGTITASMASCCRISTSQNNRDGDFRTETSVVVGNSNDSPVSSLPPILNVPDNGIFQYQVPAIDPNSDALTYRLATSTEASGGSSFAQPTGLSISSTGLLTWNVRDSVLTTGPGQLWSAQIMVVDSQNAKTPVDFLLKIGQPAAVNSPPAVSPSGVSFQPIAGQTLTFAVTATDSDGTINALQALNPPAGMTFSSFGSPAASKTITATWTPTQQQANQSFVITFQATDNAGATGTASVTISPAANAPPTASAGGPYSVVEGGSVLLASSGVDPEGTAVTFEWDLDYTGVFDTDAIGSTAIFSAATLDGPMSRQVAVRATDGFGLTTISTATVSVLNAAPQVTSSTPRTANEGDTIHYAASFTDPGIADTHTVHWHVSDSANNLLADVHGPTLDFTPADDGIYSVSCDVIDDDLDAMTVISLLTVNNVAPQNVSAGDDQTVDEGDTVSLGGSFTDPGAADTHTQSWSVMASNGQVVPDGSGNLLSFVPTDNGTYTVTYTVTDDDGGTTSGAAIVTVNNVAPVASADINQTTENASSATDVIPNDTDAGTMDVLSLVSSSAMIVSMTRNSDSIAISPLTASVSQSGNSISFNPGGDFDFLAVGETATVLRSRARIIARTILFCCED